MARDGTSTAPQHLSLKDNRDDRGRVEIAARRAFLTTLAVLLALALLNVFGQEERRSTHSAEAATLTVSAPHRLRGGLFFESRFTVEAERNVKAATLVLARGWTEAIHINTIEPSPVGESSRDGRLALDMGHVSAGDRIVLFMQMQVNPTNVGHRSQDVELYDGEELLARVDRTVTVFP